MKDTFKYIFSQAIFVDETVDLVKFPQEIEEKICKTNEKLEILPKCHYSLFDPKSNTMLFKGENALGLFHVEWNDEIKKYIFRKVNQIFTPLSKKTNSETALNISDDTQDETGIKMAMTKIENHFTYEQNIFNPTFESNTFETKIKNVLRQDQRYSTDSRQKQEDNLSDINKELIKKICLQHYEMLKCLKKAVIINTLEFCDLFRSSYQSDVSTFLKENTVNFRNRRLINNSFYPKKLHEIRNKMIQNYDQFDQQKATNTEFWLWEEMHSFESGHMKLKGYDESIFVAEQTTVDFLPEKIHMDCIEIEYSLKKMISFDDIVNKLQVSPDIVMKYFSLCHFVKLINGKYTKENTNDPVRNQIVAFLRSSDIIKKKEIGFSDEKHFKKVLKEYCEYEKGQWRIIK